MATETTTMPCLWFQWIGGPWCEDCGEVPADHAGLSWWVGGGPFGGGHEVHVPWDEYGPGKRLDVPMFTSVFGVPRLRVTVPGREPLLWEGDQA